MNVKKTETFITYFLGFIIIVCCVFIIKDYANYKTAQTEYEKLSSYIDLPDEAKEQTQEKIDKPYVSQNIVNRSEIEKLQEINPDFTGILSIPGLGLTYPVVQGADNEKYLHCTFEGKKNPAGCLFIDHTNSRFYTDDNTIIYGHNMKDGSMFGSLKRFIKEDFDKSEVRAFIITKSGRISYKLEKAEVVNIDAYKVPKEMHDTLTLYACWSNEKNHRLLVTFIKEKG